MNRFVAAAVIGVGIAVCGYPPSLLAQQSKAPPAATSQRIRACSLLPKEEVKKHLPWNAIVDDIPVDEEPVGTLGSSCNYPSVFIQVWPVGRKSSKPQAAGLEPIDGVGETAYFRNNRDNYAELYVTAEKHTLTLQADVPTGGTVESVKPRVVALAKALLAKLR